MTFKMIIWMLIIINLFKESKASYDFSFEYKKWQEKRNTKLMDQFDADFKKAIRSYRMSKDKAQYKIAMEGLRSQVWKLREYGYFKNWEEKKWTEYRNRLTRQVKNERID